MKITALDFSKAPSGMLVKRSPHQVKELCLKGKKKNQIGIVTGFKFYEDDAKSAIVCEPEVYWEGELFSKGVHPVNVVPYRKSVRLPEITFVEGDADEKCAIHYINGRMGDW